jgi:uncharacterized protein YukE
LELEDAEQIEAHTSAMTSELDEIQEIIDGQEIADQISTRLGAAASDLQIALESLVSATRHSKNAIERNL